MIIRMSLIKIYHLILNIINVIPLFFSIQIAYVSILLKHISKT